MAMTSTTATGGAALKAALAACAVPIDEVAAVKAAASEMERTGGAADAAQRRLARYLGILDANRRGDDAPTFSEDAVLEAVEHAPVARVEDARAARDAKAALATYQAAVDAEKARRRALVVAATREEAARLFAKVKALSEGENANLSMLDEARRSLNGGSIADPTAWVELMPSTPVFQGRVDAWRAALVSGGLLDE